MVMSTLLNMQAMLWHYRMVRAVSRRAYVGVRCRVASDTFGSISMHFEAMGIHGNTLESEGMDCSQLFLPTRYLGTPAICVCVTAWATKGQLSLCGLSPAGGHT